MERRVEPQEPVTVHEPDRFFPGYTLFCHTYDPPAPAERARVLLINMEGRLVHEWNPDTAVQLCQLLPNGNLLYSTRDRSDINQAGLREMDPAGNVEWFHHCRIDHDFHLMDDGHLMLHCLMDRMVPQLGPGLRRCPYVIEIDRDGRLYWEWHGEEHVEELRDLVGLKVPPDWEARVDDYLTRRMQWDESLRDADRAAAAQRLVAAWSFDWAHNNNCEVMPPNASADRDTRFAAGNILFSYRSLDIIGVIDRGSGDIVWAWGPGELDGQHKPTMLASGNVLIFDNGTARGWSRVIELDPIAGKIVWEYTATPKRGFCSAFISGADLLPNGNVFICEGGPARLFEVTRQGEIVWEYRSPYGGAGTHGIYRAVRYGAEEVQPLLKRVG